MQRSENAAKANTVARKVLNQRSYDRTDKKMHFMIRIKGQKQESLKGQSQHHINNVIDHVYNRTTLNLNTIVGNNGNRMLRNLIGI